MNHSQVRKEELELSDAPASQAVTIGVKPSSNFSYKEAVQKWKTINDVTTWIAQNFCYDISRALELADDSETRQRTPIYTPTETYNSRGGVCIDLSRFAFETIQAIDANIDVRYLMIEFEPIIIGNSTLRRHWMVIYKENDQFHIIADTKRPDHIAGPYNDISDFIADYQKFRKREIISYRLLNSYEKSLKREKRLKKKRAVEPS